MDQTDREILGYSRYVVLAAAFSAMFIISPFEYAWSSMSGHIGAIYGWSPEQVALMFTRFILFQSGGVLPGGLLPPIIGPPRAPCPGGRCLSYFRSGRYQLRRRPKPSLPSSTSWPPSSAACRSSPPC